MKLYVLQEKSALYTWIDVYECNDLRLIKRYKEVISCKNKFKTYRICEVR